MPAPYAFTRAGRPHHHGALPFALVLAFILAAQLFAASPPSATISLGDSLGSVEILRCHFDEDRIVFRYTDKIHVLREGGVLEGTELRVAEITPEAATLTIRQSSPAGSLRVIRITETGLGTILLREYATDPAALAIGSTTAAPKAPISSTAKAAPPATASSGG